MSSVYLQPLLHPHKALHTCLLMLKWGGGLPSAKHLISTRSPSFSIPTGSTSNHTFSAGSAYQRRLLSAHTTHAGQGEASRSLPQAQPQCSRQYSQKTGTVTSLDSFMWFPLGSR